MKQVYKIIPSGEFVESVIINDDEKLPDNCIEVKPEDGFHKPMWDGQKWYEGDKESVFKLTKSQKLSNIKTSFFNALESGYLCSNNIKMDADIQSISMLKSGFDLANLTSASTMNIRDYNNNIHKDVKTSDVENMLFELGSNFQKQLDNKWLLETKVNLAITPEELDKIVW